VEARFAQEVMHMEEGLRAERPVRRYAHVHPTELPTRSTRSSARFVSRPVPERRLPPSVRKRRG
jgi:hypothetical protein